MAFLLRSFCLFLVLLAVCEWTCVSTYNLDTDNAFKKVGEPGSLFGFSLAMHRQLRPTDKRMLLVGAPRAPATRRQQSKITGGLYSCEVTPQSNDCKRVDFDDDEDRMKESKENQWMGVTVQSQGPGGKILACAHRYQQRHYVGQLEEVWDITGRCYVLSQDLTIDSSSDEDGGNWKFCEGRPRGHLKFGYCQQGLSATFTKDYHYLVFGAPGAYNWKGIVRAEQKNDTLIYMNILDDGPYETGGEKLMNEDLVPVPSSSYFGFSLDSGHSITKKGQLTIVAGAPRAYHSGAVVLLKKEETSRMLTEEHKLHGEGLASSFGYDVAVVDLNSDGWQDIVVGAPQYFLKDKDVGGAVYVYINPAGNWKNAAPTTLTGTKDSMFGLAVENIGDINQDSFGDIAVGAPYEMNGAGKVFIYHGSNKGINTKPAQILVGNDPKIKLFGYSLAGNMDLDRNSYPDLAVGSLSDTVLMYRAKPIVNIERRITMTPNQIDLKKKNCGDSVCVTIDACFTYTANPKSYSPTLTIKYVFEADSERKNAGMLPRVVFQTKSPTDSDFQQSGTLELKGQNKETCVQGTLKLKDNVEDKLRGIPVEVSVLVQSSSRRRRDVALPQLVPALNSNQKNKTISEINFVKEGCGNDNICQSNLNLAYKFVYRDPSHKFLGDLPVQNGIPMVTLSDKKDIALQITVTNKNGENAYEAKLHVTFPSYLSYVKYNSEMSGDQHVTCTTNEEGSTADCDLANPFKKDAQVTFNISLSMDGISLNTTEIEVDLMLHTISEQKGLAVVVAKALVIMELQLSVSGVAKPSQVFFGGEVKGESAIMADDEIGTLIEYEFRIINLGRPLKSLGTASLNFEWPKENTNGKWLLYLLKINTNGLEKISCSPQTEINPLRTIKVARQKRAAEKQEEGGILSRFTEKRKYKTLVCGEEASCVTIRCPLEGLDSNAVVFLRSRLWNSTFLEDYSDMNYLDIIVKASLQLDGSMQNVVFINAETQVRVTVFPEKPVAKYTGMPWWIILVAILIGLLLLALLAFLLWKCGFFKRSKYDDDIPKYHAVRIKRTEHHSKDEKANPTLTEKKQWMTTWKENESYS